MNFLREIKGRLLSFMKYFIFQYPRILKYKILSTCVNIEGRPKCNQPVLFWGNGRIIFEDNVTLGITSSPFLYNGYGYLEARNKKSVIKIGKNVFINNNFVMVSDGEGIEIGENTLIGYNVEIIDSDFHELNPDRRRGGVPKTAKVVLESNVFVGSNVKILKGVVIGKNSVIANGSVVTKSIAANAIAGGNPCKEIRQL